MTNAFKPQTTEYMPGLASITKQISAANAKIEEEVNIVVSRIIAKPLEEAMTEIGEYFPGLTSYESHAMGHPFFNGDDAFKFVDACGDEVEENLLDVLDILRDEETHGAHYPEVSRLPWFAALQRVAAIHNLLAVRDRNNNAYLNGPMYTVSKRGDKWVFSIGLLQTTNTETK